MFEKLKLYTLPKYLKYPDIFNKKKTDSKALINVALK